LNILDIIETSGVRVLHKENGRMSSARNYGVKHSNGTLIAALDADDFFHPSFFEKAVAVLEKHEEIAVVSSYIQMFGEFKKVSKPRGGDAYNFLFSSQCPACAMVRKSCWNEVGGYDEEMKNGYEDWEFYIRITKKGWKVHIIPEILFYYRQTSKSTHKNFTLPNRAQLINYLVEKHKDWYLEKLKELIIKEEVIYLNSRISFQRIGKMIVDRIKRKYV
jgi:GT2 family glycosyltransferase